MNAPAANSTRASLEVARVALERMMGAPPNPGAPRTVPTMATRAGDAWEKCEIVLRGLTNRVELAGQELLTEARHVGALDMDGIHALVAMREWVERTLAPGSAAQMLTLPPTDAEREVATNALAALQRAVGGGTSSTQSLAAPSSFSPPATADVSTIPTQPETGPRSPWAPQRADASGDARGVTAMPSSPFAQPTAPQRVAATPASTNASFEIDANENSNARSTDSSEYTQQRSISSEMIMAILLLIVVLVGGGAFFYFRNSGAATSSSPTELGVAAYARGSKEAARLAFVRAIEEDPNDARALTYLGRISRELGSMATARQYLERAIRIDPNNALASRELASALLADEQYEIARRFYVRALTIEPSDRMAQGFLGCALFKLNRNDEAQRWMDRAGTGEWSGCAPARAAPPSK